MAGDACKLSIIIFGAVIGELEPSPFQFPVVSLLFAWYRWIFAFFITLFCSQISVWEINVWALVEQCDSRRRRRRKASEKKTGNWRKIHRYICVHRFRNVSSLVCFTPLGGHQKKSFTNNNNLTDVRFSIRV